MTPALASLVAFAGTARVASDALDLSLSLHNALSPNDIYWDVNRIHAAASESVRAAMRQYGVGGPHDHIFAIGIAARNVQSF